MIDELAFAGPEHLDADFVAGYDRKQGMPDPAEDIAELHGQGVRTVVDLGAGTGRFALAAARVFKHVTAVDVSPVMLARIQEKAPPNLTCVRAGFLTYQGEPVDAVHTRNALHQLPDFWKVLALERIGRLLKPGGALRLRDLIYDFSPSEVDAVFQDWFAHAATDPEKGYTAEDYSTHIRTEFSTFRFLLEDMLRATGFDIVRAEFERRLYGAYTCVRRQ
jgi:ubiquinone/menaquinone biosynthesis C-methylase UbiE